jgi:tetrapyrrole methylase family protein/MazG family protein
LGPGPLADLTLAAWNALHSGRPVFVRTTHHPCVTDLRKQLRIESFDTLYEQHNEFADVYAAIAQRIVERGQREGGVVYAVPGHPWIGEATTPLICQQAQEKGLRVEIIGGSSFIEPAFAAVGIDGMNGSQIVDAMLVARQHYPRVETTLPLLLGQLYARWLASEVKLTLLNAYPATHSVTLIRAAGTPEQQTQRVPLHELDRLECIDHLTSLYVPPLPPESSFSALQEIVAHLRAPEGCPWDREQTLASLRQDLLGETVEVLEAIDVEESGEDNSEHIAEELGDLLLLPTMMTQIATEEGRFQMGDVMRSIVQKLVRRHPHVFDQVTVDGVGQVLTNWDAIKAQEKRQKGEAPHGPLDGVPATLPALEKARKLQSKAAKANLLDRTALAATVPELFEQFSQQPTEETLGQLLWGVVALAKEHEINAEDALRSTVVDFRRARSENDGGRLMMDD